MNKLSQEALAQLFTEARTFSFFQKKEVTDETLKELYELTKWGPTSVNLAPMRIVFAKSEDAKAKIIPSLMESNIDKVKSAPVTAIIAWDEKFFDQIGKLFPHAAAYREMFATNTQLAEATQFRNSWSALASNGTQIAVFKQNAQTDYALGTDGVNWTSQTIPAAVAAGAVCWFVDRYLVCRPGSTTAHTSLDGVNWTVLTLPSSGWNRICTN